MGSPHRPPHPPNRILLPTLNDEMKTTKTDLPKQVLVVENILNIQKSLDSSPRMIALKIFELTKIRPKGVSIPKLFGLSRPPYLWIEVNSPDEVQKLINFDWSIFEPVPGKKVTARMAKPKTPRKTIVFARGIEHGITKTDLLQVLKSVDIELEDGEASIYCFRSPRPNARFSAKLILKTEQDREKALTLGRIVEPDTHTTFQVEPYREQPLMNMRCAICLKRGHLAKHCSSQPICATCSEVKTADHKCSTVRCPACNHAHKLADCPRTRELKHDRNLYITAVRNGANPNQEKAKIRATYAQIANKSHSRFEHRSGPQFWAQSLPFRQTHAPNPPQPQPEKAANLSPVDHEKDSLKKENAGLKLRLNSMDQLMKELQQELKDLKAQSSSIPAANQSESNFSVQNDLLLSKFDVLANRIESLTVNTLKVSDRLCVFEKAMEASKGAKNAFTRAYNAEKHKLEERISKKEEINNSSPKILRSPRAITTPQPSKRAKRRNSTGTPSITQVPPIRLRG